VSSSQCCKITVPLRLIFFEQARSAQTISDNNAVTSVLHQLQNDILELSDARIPADDEVSERKNAQYDDSIVITSCHSALREVQGLHDYYYTSLIKTRA